MVLSLLLAMYAAATSPEAQIRGLIRYQQDAWNRGDIREFMTTYDNSPETTYIGRSVRKGYQSILENYQKRYPGKEGMGQLLFDEIEVRMLGADYAIATGQYHVKRDARSGGDASGRFTLILRRVRDTWRIVHDHSS